MLCPGCISPQVMDEIKKDEIERKNECIRRNTPSERKRKNDARQKYRHRNKEVPGDYKKKIVKFKKLSISK